MTLRILILGLGFASIVVAADTEPPQEVRVSQTQRVDFPAGGTLRLPNSNGLLSVEGWDRPDVEITTIKYTNVPYNAAERETITHQMDGTLIVTTRQGDDLVITTNSVKHAKFALEYEIKAPKNARLIVNHRNGEVYVDGLLSDIDVTLHDGDVILHLPQDAVYNVRAKCTSGNVTSDYPGAEHRRWWLVGHQMEDASSLPPHKLNLKVGYGEILIMKKQIPKPPEPLAVATKPS